MKRVIRVLIYEGEDSWVDATIAKSIHGQVKVPLGTITALTVPECPALDLGREFYPPEKYGVPPEQDGKIWRDRNPYNYQYRCLDREEERRLKP